MKPKKKANTVARLRASRDQFREYLQVVGRTAGDEWAREHAEYKELIDVASGELSSHDWNNFSLFHAGGHERHATFEHLLAHLADDEDLSNALVRAFVAGASEVWEEVRPKVCPHICETGDEA